ncbi:MAG: hypothetical protein OHK0013_13410 [Sandaracinaceae bacterium]
MINQTNAGRLAAVAVGVVWLLLAAALALLLQLRPFGTPQEAVVQCVHLAGSGDLETFFREDRCRAMTWRVEDLVQRMGHAEFERIIGIYRQAIALGAQRFEAARESALALGEARFRALPSAERREIQGRSRRAWVLRRGLASMSPDERRGIPSEETLLVPTERDAAVTRLGEELMDAEMRAVVSGRSDAELAAMGGTVAAFAEVRREAGNAALSAIERRATELGESQFRRLPQHERTRIADRSYLEYAYRTGLSELSSDEQAILTSAEFILDASHEERHLEIGRALLPEPARSSLPTATLEQFVAAQTTVLTNRRLVQSEKRLPLSPRTWLDPWQDRATFLDLRNLDSTTFRRGPIPALLIGALLASCIVVDVGLAALAVALVVRLVHVEFRAGTPRSSSPHAPATPVDSPRSQRQRRHSLSRTSATERVLQQLFPKRSR